MKTMTNQQEILSAIADMIENGSLFSGQRSAKGRAEQARAFRSATVEKSTESRGRRGKIRLSPHLEDILKAIPCARESQFGQSEMVRSLLWVKTGKIFSIDSTSSALSVLMRTIGETVASGFFSQGFAPQGELSLELRVKTFRAIEFLALEYGRGGRD